MAADIRCYRPEISIKIGGAEYADILGDRGSVRVTKAIHAPAGEAHLSFPDIPIGGESAYGIWSPFMPIEIRARRFLEGNGNEWKTLFRGVLRSIGRDEAIDQQGRPQRFVYVVAHDCGAMFMMEQVYRWITFQNKGSVAAIPALNYLLEYGLLDTPRPSADVLWDIARISTESMMSAAGFAFEPVLLTATGTILPRTALSTEGPVWGLLDRYCDRPWNELFVREGETGPEFVYRPTPWFTSDGSPLPDAAIGDVKYYEIPKSNIIALQAHRDDAEMVNHVWVDSPVLASIGLASAITSSPSVPNQGTAAQFGDRIQIKQTFQGPTGEMQPVGLPKDRQIRTQESWVEWVAKRREWLRLAGEDTHHFERGTIQCKGYPWYRVGDYIRVKRSAMNASLWWVGYIVGVSHQFQPFNRYVTSIEYIRSTQWMRRKSAANPYWVEQQRGVDVA